MTMGSRKSIVELENKRESTRKYVQNIDYFIKSL